MATLTKLVFKVLRGDQSCSGGSHVWSLPKDGNPGEWHSLPAGKSPVLCETGFHVTEEPAHWMDVGCTVYVAETRGAIAPPNTSHDDPTKFATAECRLLREATTDELIAVGIYVSGKHVCRRKGKSLALGNSQVTAWGNSQVTARENSQVTAWDNSQVTAWDNSQVTAWDNSQVTARDNSQVTAKNEVTVIVQKSYYGVLPKVSLEDRASEINWASGWAEFRTAAKPQ